jgi:hypothetical protein
VRSLLGHTCSLTRQRHENICWLRWWWRGRDWWRAGKLSRGLVMPGQRRIHFKGESDARRAGIVDAILALGVHAFVYDAGRYSDPKRARDACLIRLVDDLASVRAERLVLEREDAALKGDNALLYVQVRKVGIDDALRYDHMRAYEESLLALPDAIAWCWAKGGHRRRRVRPLVETVKRV